MYICRDGGKQRKTETEGEEVKRCWRKRERNKARDVAMVEESQASLRSHKSASLDCSDFRRR